MEGKIKVVWICHFSNSDVRNKVHIDETYYRKILCSLMRRPCRAWNDFAVWNTNAIKQFEKYSDIDLTVVFPYPGLKGLVQRFDNNGIHYVSFRSEDDNFLSFIKDKLFENNIKTFRKNRGLISSIIKEVNPDIVHVIGAENPYYSIAALDIPDNIPSIISTQTLMSLPNFLKNYPISKSSYEFCSKLEQQILKQCSYVATVAERSQKFIRENINPNAIFLQMPLALGVDIDVLCEEKKYDFVYFAANINKACDYAIEAFALACKIHPGLTLNVSGNFAHNYKTQLDKRLQELGIQGQVFFTGPKALMCFVYHRSMKEHQMCYVRQWLVVYQS